MVVFKPKLNDCICTHILYILMFTYLFTYLKESSMFSSTRITTIDWAINKLFFFNN